ncbi:MAG: hypothetical protein JRM83_04460 [Nitrososphaerota archaeon]|nr:hypothetical protein [Nitrososphaerota archaeon]
MSEAGLPPAPRGEDAARRRTVLALAVVAIVAAGAVLAVYAGGLGGQPSTSGQGGTGTVSVGGPGTQALMNATCSSVASSPVRVENVTYGGSGSHVYFLIIETDPASPYAGMNGSANVPVTAHWPVIYVKQNQTVSIHVINCASSEAHGFQISHYDSEARSLNAIQPGGSYSVTFTATEVGAFRIYCSIFCSIHPLMQNGYLVVTG